MAEIPVVSIRSARQSTDGHIKTNSDFRPLADSTTRRDAGDQRHKIDKNLKTKQRCRRVDNFLLKNLLINAFISLAQPMNNNENIN
jgi:hypothetical protein